MVSHFLLREFIILPTTTCIRKKNSTSNTMWRVSPLLSSSTWLTVAIMKPYLSACFTSGQRFKFHSLLLSKKWEAAGVLPLNVWLGVAVTITNHGLDPLLLAHADSGTIDDGVQHYNARLLLTKCRPKPPTFLLHIAPAFGPPHFIPRCRTSSPNTVRLCSLGFEVYTITPGLWHMILEICQRSKPSAETGKCECFGE